MLGTAALAAPLLADDPMTTIQVEVTIDLSRPENGVYILAGRLVNTGDAQATSPAITFEFLDATGNVVATADLAGEALAGGSSSRFDFQQSEPGIVAWRYRVGS